MRDVSFKSTTLRRAVAEARLSALPETLARVKSGDLPKADPVPVARTAAIMAVKNSPQIIPYCHPIPIEDVTVDIDLLEDGFLVRCDVVAIAKTGVEMEAMAGAASCVLNLYDMLKIIDDTMEIGYVRLLSKTGGKSDRASVAKTSTAVVVVSDSLSEGRRQDGTGPAVAATLESRGAPIGPVVSVPDEIDDIQRAVNELANDHNCVICAGGTGVGPRDVTPEALEEICDKRLPGVEEAIRSYGQDRFPRAMLSRSFAGILGSTVVLGVPGSPGGASDAVMAVFPDVLHACEAAEGVCHDPEEVIDADAG
jgi:molybdenum cofactor biosynthesis protein MoaC